MADIGDAVKLRPLVEPLLRGDVARQDIAGDRGVDLDVGGGDPRLLDIRDLPVAHAEVTQGVDRVLRDQAGPRFQRPVAGRSPLRRVAAADADQEELFGGQQVAGVVRRKKLVFPDKAAGGVFPQLEDPPVRGRDDAVQPLIVHGHPAGHPQKLGGGGAADLVGAHADQLAPFGADADAAREVGRGRIGTGRHRLQAHAADGTVRRAVGPVLGVHRAGIAGGLAGRCQGGGGILLPVGQIPGRKEAHRRENYDDVSRGRLHVSSLREGGKGEGSLPPLVETSVRSWGRSVWGTAARSSRRRCRWA